MLYGTRDLMGLDIGSSSVKCVLLEAGENGYSVDHEQLGDRLDSEGLDHGVVGTHPVEFQLGSVDVTACAFGFFVDIDHKELDVPALEVRLDRVHVTHELQTGASP